MIAKRFFTWFFSRPQEPDSWLGIISWWELRRVPYNLMVGLVGIISLLLFFLFIDLAHELKPGEDAIEPLVLLITPVVINICYTAGWVAELFLRIVWREKSHLFGPLFLKLGLSFSLVVVLLPSVMWFFIWVVRSI